EHRLPSRPRARHRLHRPQRAELPAPQPPLPRARRPDTGLRDVVLGQLPRLRPRVVGSTAVRPAAQPLQPALRPPPVRGDALAADRARDGRRLRAALARPVRDAARLLGTVPLALPRPADLGAVVDGAGPHARLPRRLRDPLLRTPRDARLRPLCLANREPRQPELRAGARRAPASG